MSDSGSSVRFDPFTLVTLTETTPAKDGIIARFVEWWMCSSEVGAVRVLEFCPTRFSAYFCASDLERVSAWLVEHGYLSSENERQEIVEEPVTFSMRNVVRITDNLSRYLSESQRAHARNEFVSWLATNQIVMPQRPIPDRFPQALRASLMCWYVLPEQFVRTKNWLTGKCFVHRADDMVKTVITLPRESTIYRELSQYLESMDIPRSDVEYDNTTLSLCTAPSGGLLVKAWLTQRGAKQVEPTPISQLPRYSSV